MFEIDKLGIGRVMEECLDYLNDHQQLHVSYDIDALDPFYAPHTGTAVRGGLTFREGNYICEILADTNKLRSMDLVEVNPSLHPDLDHTRTIEVALTIIGSAMGQKIL
jgi:arginase